MANELIWIGWPRITDFGTMVNWQLDPDDEEQEEADAVGMKAEYLFVLSLIKQKEQQT